MISPFAINSVCNPVIGTAARTDEIYEQPGRERSNHLKEKTEREIEPVLNAPLEEVKGILNLSFLSCRYSDFKLCVICCNGGVFSYWHGFVHEYFGDQLEMGFSFTDV